jgi:hypothetical protein
MRYGSSHPPIALWLMVALYLLFAGVNSPNLFISIPVFIYPIFLYRLFWISNQPNVIFWGLMFQWLNVTAQLLYSTILGISMADYMRGQEYPVELFNQTILLSIIALYFYALGMFLAVRKLRVDNIYDTLLSYSPKSVLRWYIIISIIIYSSRIAIWRFGGFVQYFYFAFYVKWGLFLVTFYIIHKRAPQLRLSLYATIAFECLLGFSSFFADAFLNILIFTTFGIAALQPKLKLSGYFLLAIMGVLFFNLGVYWSASKNKYREYLKNKAASGSFSQSSAISTLADLVSEVDEVAYQDAIRALVDRVGYVQYFDATLGYVPAVVPHQGGAVYAKALKHYLVPRFLDSKKEVLDDSKHTNEFTGLGLSGAAEQSSFSLGSVADAYIDFGEVFMFIPLFIFGYLMGSCYSYLWRNTPNQLWAWVFTGPFYLLVNIYGADTTKAIGFILIYFVTMFVIKNWLIRILEPRLSA